MAKRKMRLPPATFRVDDRFIEMADREAAKLTKHSCPIYRPKTAVEPELIGTGVFLSVGRGRFLLTAGHVFGPMSEGHQHLLIPSGKTGNLVDLTGKYVRNTLDQKDGKENLSDVGIVLLEDGLADQIDPDFFVTLNSIDSNDTGDCRKFYSAIGYPWRVSPKVCRRSRVAEATVFSYTSELLADDSLHRIGVSRKTHFLLRYDKRHSRTRANRDITAPDPHGVSGSPLWRIDALTGQGTSSHLVGIVIEWRRRDGGLLATRLPMTLAGIRELCPDSADLIPETPTLAIEITTPPLSDSTATKLRDAP